MADRTDDDNIPPPPTPILRRCRSLPSPSLLSEGIPTYMVVRAAAIVGGDEEEQRRFILANSDQQDTFWHSDELLGWPHVNSINTHVPPLQRDLLESATGEDLSKPTNHSGLTPKPPSTLATPTNLASVWSSDLKHQPLFELLENHVRHQSADENLSWISDLGRGDLVDVDVASCVHRRFLKEDTTGATIDFEGWTYSVVPGGADVGPAQPHKNCRTQGPVALGKGWSIVAADSPDFNEICEHVIRPHSWASTFLAVRTSNGSNACIAFGTKGTARGKIRSGSSLSSVVFTDSTVDLQERTLLRVLVRKPAFTKKIQQVPPPIFCQGVVVQERIITADLLREQIIGGGARLPLTGMSSKKYLLWGETCIVLRVGSGNEKAAVDKAESLSVEGDGFCEQGPFTILGSISRDFQFLDLNLKFAPQFGDDARLRLSPLNKPTGKRDLVLTDGEEGGMVLSAMSTEVSDHSKTSPPSWKSIEIQFLNDVKIPSSSGAVAAEDVTGKNVKEEPASFSRVHLNIPMWSKTGFSMQLIRPPSLTYEKQAKQNLSSGERVTNGTTQVSFATDLIRGKEVALKVQRETVLRVEVPELSVPVILRVASVTRSSGAMEPALLFEEEKANYPGPKDCCGGGGGGGGEEKEIFDGSWTAFCSFLEKSNTKTADSSAGSELTTVAAGFDAATRTFQYRDTETDSIPAMEHSRIKFRYTDKSLWITDHVYRNSFSKQAVKTEEGIWQSSAWSTGKRWDIRRLKFSN